MNRHCDQADPREYLGHCDVIDWRDREVFALATRLASELDSPTASPSDPDIRRQLAEATFCWVRDEVRHSGDHHLSPTTCAASEVLAHRSGFCYSKSHLLCALLRANGIPAGLCYQRLSVDGEGAPFCLHGLAAIHLAEEGWYRADPRGNRDGIEARFTPPVECLAFPTDLPGERDLPGIHSVPLPSVVEALLRNRTWQSVVENLPDVGASD